MTTKISSHVKNVRAMYQYGWFGSVTKTDIRRIQRTVRIAERIIVSLCPASKNVTPPEWGKGVRKSLWTPHTQPALSLNCYHLAGATEHWAPKQPDTRTVFTPRPYPTWTTHNTPQYCTSVNNSSTLHMYIGHMHIHSSVYGHFYFLYIFYFIHNYCLFSSLLVFFITLIRCRLHYDCTFCTGSSRHQDEFLVCANTLGNKALSNSDSDSSMLTHFPLMVWLWRYSRCQWKVDCLAFS